jgi:hypothetical protein
MLVTAHLKTTVYAAYLKDLYEDVSAYFGAILAAAARKGVSPDRLVGEHHLNVEANDILKCQSWDRVTELVASSIFRRLEDQRSTQKLIEGLDKKLALKLDPEIVSAAIPYLEIRHLLVHRDGVADRDFCDRYPAFGLKVGDRVALRHTTIAQARETLAALVKHCDEKVIDADLLLTKDMQT